MSKQLSELKIAIVCDWLTGVGGAELVVLELHKMFPNAPIYTSQYDPKRIDWFDNADVRTTWVNRLPKGLRKLFPVLRAFSFSHLNLSNYDLVISSSGAEAKGVKTGPNTIHVSYCHSPTHYYWTRYDYYMKSPGFGAFNWLARLGLKLLVGPMRKWDFKAAQKPNYLIANSNYTKANILEYYKRDSNVIFPPVDIDQYKPQQASKRAGLVIISRQTPYKRVDLAIKACTRLNLDLAVVGDGPEHNQLKAIAGPTIKFLGQVDNTSKINLLQASTAFIFPGIDDFGIAAVEALASGTPVVAYGTGGALDYINNKNGLLFKNQTVDDLCQSLEKLKTISFNNLEVASTAHEFSSSNFRAKLENFLFSL